MGRRHGLLARPMGGTSRPTACPCRHDTKGRAGHGPPAWPMTRPWHGTAGTAARCRHGHTSPPLLASPPPDCISFASVSIFFASPPLLSFHGRRAPSPSTAARLARTRAPWPMGGTGSTTRVNGPCAVSWAEGLAHSTVWHGTVGTAAWRSTSLCRVGTAWPCRMSCRHGTVATYTATAAPRGHDRRRRHDATAPSVLRLLPEAATALLLLPKATIVEPHAARILLSVVRPRPVGILRPPVLAVVRHLRLRPASLRLCLPGCRYSSQSSPISSSP
jgi:hypothetical protein